MKKAISYIIIICTFLFLSGCGGMRKQYLRLEKLLVIQVMGIDSHENGVRLSLASASGSGKDAVCLSNDGFSISAALDRIRSYSFEENIFCAHTSHLLIGEDAAVNGIEDLLSYICHSPELRIDLPIYIVRNGSAEETLSGIGNGDRSATELLDAIRSSLEQRGDGQVFTAAEIIGSMDRNQGALICAIEYADASEKSSEPQSDSPKTAAFCGFGVIKDFKLVHYIDKEDSVGVSFLLDKVGICDLSVEDPDGKRVTLEIDSGSSGLNTVRDKQGRLTGIHIKADVTASVLEAEGGGADFDSPEYADFIVSQLETQIAEKIGAVLRLSKSLRTDFLDLAGRLEMSDPQNFRAEAEDFCSLLPELELRISVSGRLSHTSDLKDV